MRTRIALVALAVGAAAVWSAPASAGPQQAGLQVALRALGLYNGPVDGIVGPATRQALAAAPRSLGPLGRPSLGSRLVERGCFGLDVSVVQFALEQRGLYAGALDGYYDTLTEQAVRRFQLRARLGVDGVVGPATIAALLHPTPVRAVVASTDVRATLDAWASRLGVSGELVRALAWMESGYQTDLVSSAGARGVLQVLPSSRRYVEDVLVGHPLPRTLDGDVEAGVLYLRQLLREFHGDQRLALAAWYQGAAAVRARGVYDVTKPFVADVLALEARM